MTPYTGRTPNERALDEQHGLIRQLEAVEATYARLNRNERVPAQRLRGVLAAERKWLVTLRTRVERERSRPGG